MSKREIISKINKIGIQDIFCTSIVDDESYIYLCLEIRTKDDNSFHFQQRLKLNPKFEEMEVFYFDETGNGRVVAELGTGFNPKKYKYVVRDTNKDA